MKSVIVLAAAMLLAVPASAVQINEIRIDHPGTDTDEYFELAGQPGEILDGLTYIVIGDGAAGSGVIESVTDLTGYTLLDDGLLSVHKDGTVPFCNYTEGGYDVELPMNFENSDNVTHLLVSGFVGADGDDLDVDDDGVLDVTPWTEIIDCVALLEEVGGGDLVYCDTQVGPDGTFVPGHVLFCEGSWYIGLFDACTLDTPGEPNACDQVSAEESTWSGVKELYR
ncbi:MAG: hypothetical protein R6X25_13835 [Candidatus Krumholzibacteriia bacterium]